MNRVTMLQTAALAAVIVLAFQALLFETRTLLRANNSTTPSKPFTFAPGLARSSEVNSNFDALFNGLADIGRANIITDGVGSDELQAGAVTEAKLDSAVAAKLALTGAVYDYIGTTAPSGYVLLCGRSIGNGSSAGTERANADTESLFTLLWNSMSDTQAPVSGGRGASAAADFAANKRITLPDLRGRVIAGLDYSNGGGTAGRLTVITATTNGNSGGSETLLEAQLPGHAHTMAHTHTIAHTHDMTHTHSILKSNTVGSFPGLGLNDGAGGLEAVGSMNVSSTGGSSSANSGSSSAANTGSAGSGSAHCQPTFILNKIIKLWQPTQTEVF